MKPQSIKRMIAITLVLSAFIIISAAIKTTEAVWIQTRVFGLLSYAALLVTVVLGEWRLLMINKGRFKLFKYHKPVAIFALTLVALHFISAAFDKFKWGKGLSFAQYLGFSFSDKWLILLSLGTLAFYLMILVSVTSATKAIQKIGFKRWKLIHYLSYASLAIAYVHSVNLGTDLKTSFLAPVLKPLVIGSFFFATALLITRVLKGLKAFEDQWEIALAGVFFTLLLLGSMMSLNAYVESRDKIKSIEGSVEATQSSIAAYERNLTVHNQQLAAEVARWQASPNQS